ncbi:AI-2E family transporter [Amycolatopsis lurida]|uniref:AI-2E family transporter n=1 Tax=Amycolatopsis lurida TaxID=31959 RepID=UPI000A998936
MTSPERCRPRWAFVDAAGIGLVLLITGVPLAAPLSTLVLLGALVPVIGSVIAGAAVVLVTLVTKGTLAAIIVLAVVAGVMQVESHVLQPLLLGRAVRLHPLAVVLALATGLVTAGIVGACPPCHSSPFQLRRATSHHPASGGDRPLRRHAASGRIVTVSRPARTSRLLILSKPVVHGGGSVYKLGSSSGRGASGSDRERGGR